MAVNLSVKNVPAPVASALKERASRNHRSLQGELLAILEESVRAERGSLENLHRRVKRMKLKTRTEAPSMIRADRDAR